MTNQQIRWYMSSGIVAIALLAVHCTEAFVPSSSRLASYSLETSQVAPNVLDVRKRETKLGMFMGSDGGILGVGTPELVRRIIPQQDDDINSMLLTPVCSLI